MVASSRYGHAVADDLSSDPLMRRPPSMSRDMTSTRRDSQIRRAPNSAGLYDVLDLILDKGIVIDAFVRVSLVGIELLTVDLRVVIASVDTYLRYAEGVERLQSEDRSQPKSLPDMVEGHEKKQALEKGAETVGRVFTGKGDDEDQGRGEHHQESGGVVGALSRGVRNVVGRLVGEDDDDQEQGHGKKQDRGEHAPVPRRRLPDANRHQTPGRGGKPVGARR
jgi:gas vesicle structural protein